MVIGISQVTKLSQLHGSGPHDIMVRLPLRLVSIILFGLVRFQPAIRVSETEPPFYFLLSQLSHGFPLRGRISVVEYPARFTTALLYLRAFSRNYCLGSLLPSPSHVPDGPLPPFIRIKFSVIELLIALFASASAWAAILV